MSDDKRPRGRPRGSGKNDEPYLAQVAELLIREPSLKPTTAMKRLMMRHTWRETDQTLIRRWQGKWKEQSPALMAAARERARPRQTDPLGQLLAATGKAHVDLSVIEALKKLKVSFQVSPGMAEAMKAFQVPPGMAEAMKAFQVPPAMAEAMKAFQVPPGMAEAMKAFQVPSAMAEAMKAFQKSGLWKVIDNLKVTAERRECPHRWRLNWCRWRPNFYRRGFLRRNAGGRTSASLSFLVHAPRAEPSCVP